MKFTCDKITFYEAVSNVMKAVSSRSTLPVLEGILLKAYEGSLTLIGYDLEIGITTQVDASIEEPGEVVISAGYLYNIIRNMPGDFIAIQSDDKQRVSIESGITSFNILGMPPREYPELPHISSEDSFVMDRLVLKNMIDMTIFAVSKTDTRPVHTGSLIDVKNSIINIVSVDGFRLAMRKEEIDIDSGREFKFVVPRKALFEISHLIDYSKSDSDEEGKKIDIHFSGKHAVFNIDEYTIVTRLLEGEFLDYENSIPKGSTTTVTIDRKEFKSGIERSSLIITERLKSPLRCIFEDNKVKISCVTTVGRSYDEIFCEVSGSIVDIGFNNRYLLDALGYADEDFVKLEINGPLSPMKVIPTDSDKFLFLVLPMRLKNEV